MSRWELWQWRNLTAIGETEIIAEANRHLQYAYDDALKLVSVPCETISTIEQARDYFCTYETGVVKENFDFKEDKSQ